MYKWIIGIVIVLLSTAVAISLPFKNKMTLTWDASTSSIDPDFGGYKVYWRPQAQADYTDLQSRDVGNVLTANLQTTVTTLNGTYCFVVTAYDVAGNESDFSNEVCSNFTVKKNPPTNTRMQ
ncbi:MAG: hypothetical protein IT393_07240 [Nitrospirae bacterium]|nr:hypothetical protein [Nitrospirota bacterium]